VTRRRAPFQPHRPRFVSTPGNAYTETNVTSLSCTLTSPVPVGATLIAGAKSGGGVSLTTSEIADAGGNTYHLDVVENAGGPVAHIFRATITTALAKGSTWTITPASSSGNWGFTLLLVLGTGPTLDKTATGTGTASVTVNCATTAHSPELLVAVASLAGNAVAGTTITPSSGWVDIATGDTNNDFFGMGYQIVNTTVTPTCTFTPHTSGLSLVGAIATYS